MNKSFLYYHNNHEYTVDITYKRIRNIHYRFIDGAFTVSCHRLTPMNMIKGGLDKFADKLINRSVDVQGEGDDFIYLLGKRVALTYPGTIKFLHETISFENKEQLHKKLKRTFLSYLSERTMKYALMMGAPLYEVKLRDMRTRYGTNNRSTETITYATMLIHYAPETIDSVIMHELTHCFVYNHSESFYRLLYKNCPNYDDLRNKLVRAVF